MQMQVNMIIQPLACAIAFFDGRGFVEHHLASCVQIVKTLKTLEPHGTFVSSFAYYLF